jgi:hypothetical protein
MAPSAQKSIRIDESSFYATLRRIPESPCAAWLPAIPPVASRPAAVHSVQQFLHPNSLRHQEKTGMCFSATANLIILLVVMAVKRYAFTSLWCAYAAAASVIILAYSWKSSSIRPFRYAEPI